MFSEHGYEATRVTGISAPTPAIREAIKVFRPEGELLAVRPQVGCVNQLMRLSCAAAQRGECPVKVQFDATSCQGHGRCYDLAPGLFGEDDEGYGAVLGDGTVPPGLERDARRAVLNCPEHAIELVEGS